MHVLWCGFIMNEDRLGEDKKICHQPINFTGIGIWDAPNGPSKWWECGRERLIIGISKCTMSSNFQSWIKMNIIVQSVLLADVLTSTVLVVQTISQNSLLRKRTYTWDWCICLGFSSLYHSPRQCTEAWSDHTSTLKYSRLKAT